jgi:hypothetical protein
VLAAATIVVGAVALTFAGLGGSSPAVAPCTGGDELDFSCQERRYVALTESSGAAGALRDLSSDMKRQGYVRAACHQLTHRIGRTAGAKAGIAAYEDGDPVCGSGYYHGVTEAAMTKLGAHGAVRKARTVCDPLRTRRKPSAGYGECIHGMGHGFMGVLRRDITDSLEGCDRLGAAWERRDCYSGVFMENHSTVDHPNAKTLRPDEPLYPCTAVAARYKEACYDRQSTYALFVSNSDFTRVFRLCGRAERGFRDDCRRGLGGDVAGETKLIEPRARQARARHRLCMVAGSSQARADCVSGAVDVILQDLDGGPAQLDAFCGSFEVVATQPEHAACLRASEKAYKGLLAQQTGGNPEQQLPPGGTSFVCHLKKSDDRQGS